jgi:poly-gamma-glutamate capsule biosynthesis protein CapA/YwtB (metallophosphatase superfamily)
MLRGQLVGGAKLGTTNVIRLFLCGDVMIGRGIDQVTPVSVDPQLFEPSVQSAESYVELAVMANGPIPRPVAPEYVWGAALGVLGDLAPDVRIVNLETAVTTSPHAWPGKEIHYRTHPANVAVLNAAGIDCCVLANNHALDWGYDGLVETLDSLHDAGVATAGAGRTVAEALAPTVLEPAAGRVIVMALASTTSGTPLEWAAGPERPGVNVMNGWSRDVVTTIAAQLRDIRRPTDVVVASIHWGTNWGYDVPAAQRRLAHELIDVGGVDVVFGHSSHHPRPIELYRGRLILYGCGDFITDYEGIPGHEQFRNDLLLGYCAALDPATGQTTELTMAPFRLRRFQLTRSSEADARWLADSLDRHSRPFGVGVELGPDLLLRARP